MPIPEKQAKKEAKDSAKKIAGNLKKSELLKGKDEEEFKEKLAEKQVEKIKAGEDDVITFEEVVQVANETSAPKATSDDEVRPSALQSALSLTTAD